MAEKKFKVNVSLTGTIKLPDIKEKQEGDAPFTTEAVLNKIRKGLGNNLEIDCIELQEIK